MDPVTLTTAPAVATAGNLRLTPSDPAQRTLPLVQRVELLDDGGEAIAHATWFSTGTDGQVQLLHIEVEHGQRRHGVGTKLFRLMLKEADAFFRGRGQRLRRVFTNAEQKTHIVFRAFLTKQGFHHTSTLTNVCKKQDVMVYLLGLD